MFKISDIDWSKNGADLLDEINRWRRMSDISDVESCDDLIGEIEGRDIFDAKKFRHVRRRTGTQQQWAQAANVSAGTISNYENNKTSPNRAARQSLVGAIKYFRDIKKAAITGGIREQDIDIDPAQAKEALEKSILNAALTDFQYDASGQQVVAIPFKGDAVESQIQEIKEDRENLIEALSVQVQDLSGKLSTGANINVERIVSSLGEYGRQLRGAKPNARLLFRYGNTISRAYANEYISSGLNEVDKVALHGFVDDHNELMRLYYREALAKAQEVDAAEIDTHAQLPTANQFLEIARVIDSVRDDEGERVFSKDIPTLVRDIARDIEENEESEILVGDPDGKKAYRRRRVEAIKTGSILVGRFLFFTSFFAVVDPAFTFGAATGISSIIGAVELVAPGTVREYYEKLREALPFLPRFPSDRKRS